MGGDGRFTYTTTTDIVVVVVLRVVRAMAGATDHTLVALPEQEGGLTASDGQ
jgi:hypothetical protein